MKLLDGLAYLCLGTLIGVMLVTGFTSGCRAMQKDSGNLKSVAIRKNFLSDDAAILQDLKMLRRRFEKHKTEMEKIREQMGITETYLLSAIGAMKNREL